MNDITLDKLVEMMYGGEARYKASLTINNINIPNSLIEKILISKPIIDKTKNYFYIGTFVSNQITIKLRSINDLNVKSGDNVRLTIIVKNNNYNILIGDFLVDDLSESYYKDFELPCLDKGIVMKTSLDYSPFFNSDGSITIDELFERICKYYNLEFEEYPKLNGDIEIGTYDSTISGKQWLSYIAEIKGCNLKITNKNKVKLIPFKYNFIKSKNKIYTDIGYWERGNYSTTDGSKITDSNSIRLVELFLIDDTTKSYYFDTNSSTYQYHIVTFDNNRSFVRNVGKITNKTSIKFNSNEKYLGISIVSNNSVQSKLLTNESGKNLLTEDNLVILLDQNIDYVYYKYLFENGVIKPIIYYSDETDKTYSEYKETPIENYKIKLGKTKSLELGERYKITKVSYYDATREYTFGNDSGNTLYIRQDNPFIKDENVIYNIYQVVKDTEYYSIKNEYNANLLANPGDCILYEKGDNKYYTLYNAELTYDIIITENNNVSIPTYQQEKTTNVFNKDNNINQKIIKTEIDLLNASMKLQATEISTVKKDITNVSQQVVDTKNELNQNIQDTEDSLNQNIQDTANQINQDIIEKLKDYATVGDLGNYVTTEKLESTIDLTTDSIMQNVSKEISSTKTEINQTIETSISESESKTNQSISNAISSSESKLNQNISDSITESENKLNGNINSAIENSENKLNQNINSAVNGLEQEITTTLTKYVTTEKFDSTIELTSESILQSVSEDIETTTTNITNNIDTSITDLNNQINETLNNYATTTTVTNIKNSIENEITSTQQSINVINQVLEDGVTKVDTKTGFTFDQTGLTIAKTNADTKTNINENGMIIYASTGSTDDPMLTVNSNGVIGENMTVRTYFICGSHSRFEDYENGTGCFYIE